MSPENDDIKATPPASGLSPAEEELEGIFAEPVLKADTHIAEAQVLVAAFLVVMAGVFAYFNAFSIPLPPEARSFIEVVRTPRGFLEGTEEMSLRAMGPLARATFALQGLRAAGRSGAFHGLDLLLHFANGVLTYLLARRLLRSSTSEIPAMLAGIFVALAPLSAGAVNDTLGRGVLMGTAFALASVILFLRATGEEFRDVNAGVLSLSLLSFAAACACSLAAMATPLWILLADRARADSGTYFRRSATHAPYWVLLVAVLTAAAAVSPAPLVSSDWTAARWAGALHAAIHLALSPGDSSPWHAVEESGRAVTLAALGGAAALLAAGLVARSAFAFAAVWVLAAFTSGNLLLADSQRLDEQALYFALPGIGVAAGALLHAVRRLSAIATMTRIALAVLLALLGLQTYRGNEKWQDPIALWRHAKTVAPAEATAHYRYGRLVYDRALAQMEDETPVQEQPIAGIPRERQKSSGSLSDAVRSFRRAVELEPAHRFALRALGQALLTQENNTEGIETLRAALALQNDDAECAAALAAALARQAAQTREPTAYARARDAYRRIEQRDQLTPDTAYDYANLLVEAGAVEEANAMLAAFDAREDGRALRSLRKEIEREAGAARAKREEAERAYAAEPMRVESALGLARARADASNTLQAAYLLQDALTRDSATDEVWDLLAVVQARNGSAEQFVAEWGGSALRSDSDWLRATQATAQAGLLEAAERYAGVGADQPNAGRWLTLLQAALEQENVEKAGAYLDAARASASNDPRFILPEIDMALLRGEVDRTRSLLEAARTSEMDAAALEARQRRLDGLTRSGEARSLPK